MNKADTLCMMVTIQHTFFDEEEDMSIQNIIVTDRYISILQNRHFMIKTKQVITRI